MRLHVRKRNSAIQNGCLAWCLRFDLYQCWKHHRRSQSASASTKKAHFPIILIRESLWYPFGYYPSVDSDDVKNLLSDRILTLYIAKLTICTGMHPLSALKEIASFLFDFKLPFSLVPNMPPRGLMFLLLFFMFWKAKDIFSLRK